MSEIYGAQFANQYGETGGESFQTWCLGLRDLSPSLIRRGFAKLLNRESTFVPNLNEFRQLCHVSAQDLGVPDLTTAYHEACSHSHNVLNHAWSHPAVYEAGRRTGWYEIRSGSASKKQFKIAYDNVCESVKRGEQFVVPEADSSKLEFQHHGRRSRTQRCRETGNAALAQLKGMF